jgi:hypothetical protein
MADRGECPGAGGFSGASRRTRPARGSQRIVADAQCALLVTWRPFLFANAFA